MTGPCERAVRGIRNGLSQAQPPDHLGLLSPTSTSTSYLFCSPPTARLKSSPSRVTYIIDFHPTAAAPPLSLLPTQSISKYSE